MGGKNKKKPADKKKQAQSDVPDEKPQTAAAP